MISRSSASAAAISGASSADSCGVGEADGVEVPPLQALRVTTPERMRAFVIHLG